MSDIKTYSQDDFTDQELKELREKRKQRLLEESKLIPIEKPLPEKMVRCPRCGKMAEIKGFTTILGRKFKVYKCNECRIEFIPDIHLYRVCVRDPKNPRLILPRDCKMCPFYPGKATPCPYFRKITDIKKVIEEETGWVKL